MFVKIFLAVFIAVALTSDNGAVGSSSSCPEQCRCTTEENTGSGLIVVCHGGNAMFSQLFNRLPKNTTHLTFLAEEHESNSSDAFKYFSIVHDTLKDFTDMKSLTIRLADHTRWKKLRLTGVLSLCHMKKLEEMHLNMKLERRFYIQLSAPSYDRRITCLPSLRLVNLSYTQSFIQEDIRDLLESLRDKPQLEVLLLRAIQKVHDPYNMNVLNFSMFEPLRTSPLKELDLGANGFSDLAPGLFNNLPHLVKLVLSGNAISRSSRLNRVAGAEMFFHPKLEYIDVSRQHEGGQGDYTKTENCEVPKSEIIDFFTNTQPIQLLTAALCKTITKCYDGFIPCSFIPHPSEIVDLSCEYVLRIPIGPNLREIHFGQPKFIGQVERIHPKALHPARLCFARNNSMQVIDLTGYPGLHDFDWDNFYMDGLLQLRVLRLGQLNGVFKNPFFAGFPDLRELHLSGNRAQLDIDTTLFLNNSKLELLVLSDNGITDITQLQFAHLQSLNMLDLSGNLIRTLNFTLPTANSSELELLKLDHNNISVISRTFLSDLDRYGTSLSIDLSANILFCTCQEMYLIEWMHQTHVNIIQKETYQCQKENGDIDTIASINVGDFSEECNPSIGPVVLGSSVSAAVLIIVCVLVAVIYRKRWHIRYGLYKLQRKEEPPEPEDRYCYDAFVSYCSGGNDQRWVHHTLRAEMEENRNRRLFIYLRDLLAGGDLADRLHDAMSECRRAMFVLSPNFLASDYCMYELQTARWKLMSQGVDSLILVILEDLPMAKVPGTLTTLLEAIGYLKWTEDEQGQKLFWDKLERSLLAPPQKIFRQIKHGDLG